jgi:hypothetical protein
MGKCPHIFSTSSFGLAVLNFDLDIFQPQNHEMHPFSIQNWIAHTLVSGNKCCDIEFKAINQADINMQTGNRNDF